MTISNIFDRVMPSMIGTSPSHDCRYLSTYEGESCYEIGFLTPAEDGQSRVRLALVVYLNDETLNGALRDCQPGMRVHHEEVARQIRMKARAVLPLLDVYNGGDTDYRELARVLCSQAPVLRVVAGEWGRSQDNRSVIPDFLAS
jgi:hypothetical protein